MNETGGFSLCFSKYFRDPGYQERIVEENLFVKMYGLGVPVCQNTLQWQQPTAWH